MTLEYFIEHFGYTKNVDGEWVRIRPQTIELLHKFDNNRFNLVRKGRQVGLTTALRLYTFYQSIKSDTPKNILYYGHNSGMAQRFISDLITLSEEYLTDNLSKSRTKMVFNQNGSTIKAICNRNSLVGVNSIYDLIIFDEYAYLEDNPELIPMVTTNIDINSKMIIGSTPNGQDMFYSLWVRNTTLAHNFRWMAMNFERTHIRTTDIEEFSSREWIEDQRRYHNNDDKRYDIEVLGAFVDMNGNWLIEEQNNGIRIKYNIKKHKLNGNR